MSSRPSSFTLTSPGPLRLYSTVELLRLPPPTWLIETILPAGGLVGLYGPPGAFKSFVALDLAMSVATGRAWHGQAVIKGHAIYVAAEGGTGMGKRAQAWLLHHDIPASAVDMSWLIESVTVNPDSDQMDRLLTRVNDEMHTEPSLIVIDTLARCFEGDENTQEDMGRFVAGVDRLRREFGATVLVVHHTRLAADRERGNTAFRGAADTMISIARHDDDVTITNNKQKDAQEFLERSLTVKPMLLADSIVLVEPDTSRDETIRRVLRAHEGLTYSELSDIVSHENISRSALKRRLVGLRRNGEIAKENGKYRLVEGPPE